MDIRGSCCHCIRFLSLALLLLPLTVPLSIYSYLSCLYLFESYYRCIVIIGKSQCMALRSTYPEEISITLCINESGVCTKQLHRTKEKSRTFPHFSHNVMTAARRVSPPLFHLTKPKRSYFTPQVQHDHIPHKTPI